MIKRRRQDIPRYCQGAGKEVSSEGLKERRKGHFNRVLIMWSKWNRPGLTLKLEVCHVHFGGKQGFQSAGRSRMLSKLGSRFASVVLLGSCDRTRQFD